MTNDFILNGEDVKKPADANEILLSFLQRQFHLLSKVRHCQSGSCGRCLINLDNNLVLSCLVPFFKIKGKEIITPEGFSQTEDYKKIWEWLRRSGIEEDQDGVDVLLFAIHTLLDKGLSPDDEEVKQILDDFPTLGAPKEALMQGVKVLYSRREVRRGKNR